MPSMGILLQPLHPQGTLPGSGTGRLLRESGTGTRRAQRGAAGALGTPRGNTSAVKILHVPQLIIAINYLYRYSHFYKEGRIIINNALAGRERRLFYYLL